jgi:uncharacterized FlaG/YvyC family protein
MSSISFPVAAPPVSVTRPSQESEAQSAAAKPRARESKTAETPVAPQPVEAGESDVRVGIKLPESTRLSIDFDKQAGRYVYRLLDPATREVLREIPSEEALRRIRGLRETIGLKVDEQL